MFIDNRDVITGQLYFPDPITKQGRGSIFPHLSTGLLIYIKCLRLLIRILTPHIIGDQEISPTRIAMEKYDDEFDTFEKAGSSPTRVENWPTIEEIERRLQKLGCTEEQVKRHLDQVAVSRTETAREKSKPRT